MVLLELAWGWLYCMFFFFLFLSLSRKLVDFRIAELRTVSLIWIYKSNALVQHCLVYGLSQLSFASMNFNLSWLLIKFGARVVRLLRQVAAISDISSAGVFV